MHHIQIKNLKDECGRLKKLSQELERLFAAWIVISYLHINVEHRAETLLSMDIVIE